MPHWYALHVKRHKERAVADLLTSRSVPFFLPLLCVKPKNPRAAKQRPYFPGYLFIQVDLVQVGINTFNWMEGVNRLVAFDNTPAVVPDDLIQSLMQHMEALNRRDGTARWQPGDRVPIVGGLLAGHQGIFDAYLSGSSRVRLLLDFLGRSQTSVQLDVSDIQKKL